MSSFVAITLLSSIAAGHVVLKTPKPYLPPAYGPSNPIETSGSNWPCQIPSGTGKLQIDGAPTTMAIGETQKMSFTGLAVHGGGSCQVGLLPGFEPSKTNADFRVIKSIEGGCVATNQKGNLNGNEEPTEFPYTIPDSVAPGNYTFAWTWVSRTTGEFYSMCAPITVTSKKPASRRSNDRRAIAISRRALADLPGLFMAGMGDVSNGCSLAEARKVQRAIKYPFPGTVVDHPEGTVNLFQQPCDGNLVNNGKAPQTAPPASSSAPQPAPPASPSAPMPSAPSSSQAPVAPPSSSSPAPALSAPSTYPVPGSSSTPAPPASGIPTSVVSKPSGPIIGTIPVTATLTMTFMSAPASTAIPAPSANPGCSTGPEPCTDGYLLCVNGTMFSTCTGAKWTKPQMLAPGTKCIGGAGVGLNIVDTRWNSTVKY
ncbi:endoglucanase [Halenospora varia]|nr:endoglucanase [Halenospora varia]